MNLLLNDNLSHIPFGEFSYEDLDGAIINILDNAKELIRNQQSKSYSCSDAILLIDDAIYKLNYIWGLVHHLSSVLDSNEIRAIQEKYTTTITQFYLDLAQNEALFDLYQQLKSKPLNLEQSKVVSNSLLDFKLNGFNLSSSDKSKFNQIVTQLDRLTTKFAQNVLDSTESSVIYLKLDDLDGLPEDILHLYREDAIADGKIDLYKVSFHSSSYIPLMQYATNRNIRESAYYIYTIRASELSQLDFDNTKLIEDIIKLRYNKAKLLGYNNYTELSLEKKMAQSSDQIINFLTELTTKSMPYAKKDLQQLQSYAKQNYNIDELKPWDVLYISEKLRQEQYKYSEQELRQYFEVNNVLVGMFDLIKTLYNIDFTPNTSIKVWHKDVFYYDIYQDGQLIGGVYFDLFSRIKKHSGAWMNSMQDRYMSSTIQKLPIAYIVCNFTPKDKQNQSYLRFEEIQTLFHEMGHALHHLLTKIDHYSISGINNVEWDAVELPSQFMELFTWDYNILTKLSLDTVTGKPLPKDLYQKLLKSRYYQSGLHMLRQIEFATFDLLLHNYQGDGDINYLAILQEVQKTTSLLPIPKYNRFANSFSHIFAGGYAAGYYSYKWAEVLATDVFSKFDGIKSKEDLHKIGERFLLDILSNGSLYPMSDNFYNFMGREPQIESLLKYSFGDITDEYN